MKVIGNQCPGKTIGVSFHQQIGQTFDKQFYVDIVDKYFSPFNSSDYDVLKKAGDVQSCLSRHGAKISGTIVKFNN